jgi:hypothetical protein
MPPPTSRATGAKEWRCQFRQLFNVEAKVPFREVPFREEGWQKCLLSFQCQSRCVRCR